MNRLTFLRGSRGAQSGLPFPFALAMSSSALKLSLFQFDFHLGDDLDAITDDHDIDTSDGSTMQYHPEGDIGYQLTAQEAVFQPHDDHTRMQNSDEAGPATTLDARFGAIRSA